MGFENGAFRGDQGPHLRRATRPAWRRRRGGIVQEHRLTATLLSHDNYSEHPCESCGQTLTKIPEKKVVSGCNTVKVYLPSRCLRSFLTGATSSPSWWRQRGQPGSQMSGHAHRHCPSHWYHSGSHAARTTSVDVEISVKEWLAHHHVRPPHVWSSETCHTHSSDLQLGRVQPSQLLATQVPSSTRSVPVASQHLRPCRTRYCGQEDLASDAFECRAGLPTQK